MVKTNNHPDRISILYIFIYAFFGNILSIGQIAFITMFLFYDNHDNICFGNNTTNKSREGS